MRAQPQWACFPPASLCRYDANQEVLINFTVVLRVQRRHNFLDDGAADGRFVQPSVHVVHAAHVGNL